MHVVEHRGVIEMDSSLSQVPGTQTKLTKLSIPSSENASHLEIPYLVMDIGTKAVGCHLIQAIEGDYVIKKKSVLATSEKDLNRLSKL